MATSRKFYRTVYRIEVLSEEPIPGDLDIEDVAREITTGDYSGLVTHDDPEELDGPQAASALIAQGSDPGFFCLDEHGNDFEDDDSDDDDSDDSEDDE
jgi:hypothetical protein